MIDLSIIVVHWNVPGLLERCLHSIERESTTSDLSVETIVVDNDSDSPELRRALDQFPYVQFHPQPDNRGYAAGCNAGIGLAHGEALLILNPDLELTAGALQSLWTTLHVAPHVGMVAPLLLNPDGSVQSAGYRFPGVMNVLLDLVPTHPRLIESKVNGRFAPGDGASLYQIDYPLGAAMMVSRCAVEDVGVLDESYGMYCEEIDWARRFAERGWTILLAPAARIVHLGGRSVAQRSAEMRSALWNSRAQYFERWGTPVQRQIIGSVTPKLLRWDDSSRPANERSSLDEVRTRFAALVPRNRR